MTGIEAVIAVPWAALFGVIGAAIGRLIRRRRDDDGYVGRHRAGLLSTMEAVAAFQRRPAVDDWPTVPIPELGHGRGVRLPAPRPRSPWGTPEWVDDWTAEDEPVAS